MSRKDKDRDLEKNEATMENTSSIETQAERDDELARARTEDQ